MTKHAFIILLIVLKSTLSQAQQTDFIFKDPIIDSTLIFPSHTVFNPYNIAFNPRYIINNNYVILQKDYSSRKILDTDIKSFRTPYWSKLFAFDKNGIYFNGDFIETDTTGFKHVGIIRNPNNAEREIFWKTHNKLFKNTTEVTKDIDVPSFQSVGNGFYFKDKNFIYYKDKKIIGSDANSVSQSPYGIIYDKNYIYKDGVIALYEGDTLRPLNDFLMKTSKVALTLDYKIQPDMDAKTLKPLSRLYAMDKNFIYYKNEKTPISPRDFKNVRVSDNYISDGKNIYHERSFSITDFDIKSFGIIGSCYFDKNGIYERKWSEEEQKVLYVKIPFSYTNNVSGKNIFSSYNYTSSYLIYENQAYDLSGKKVYKNLTPEQITLAKNNKLNILLINNQLTEVEKIDFHYLYKANNIIYWKGKETIADAQTFERIWGLYYKDKNHVYLYDRDKGLIPIDGTDVETFTTFNDFFADKNYIYTHHYRIIKNDNAELLATFKGFNIVNGIPTPPFNYCLFKNTEGYWLVRISNGVRIKNLGRELSEDTRKLLIEK